MLPSNFMYTIKTRKAEKCKHLWKSAGKSEWEFNGKMICQDVCECSLCGSVIESKVL